MAKNSNITLVDSIAGNVDYKGCVSIIYFNKVDGKMNIIKKLNSGQSGLFSCITRSLSGLDISDYLPISIMGFYADNFKREAFTQRISYASKPITLKEDINEDGSIKSSNQTNGENNNTVQYTFVIPFNNIKKESSDKIKSLILYNKIPGNSEISKCAEIVLSQDEAISTSVSSGILIYWKLRFTNSAQIKVK